MTNKSPYADLNEGEIYAIKRLYQVYRIYYNVSTHDFDPDATDSFAEISTRDYVDYCLEAANDFRWRGIGSAIENHIRILAGLIECYEKVVVKEKVIEKTRRWL